jgi:Holliday junction DNA helicase RuvA
VIASLRGRLLGVGREGLVVEVGGVGLRVAATTGAHQLASAEPDDVFLHTHLVVREDALSLYGFCSEEERELFVALLGVNGVGPKAALSILSAYQPARVRLAIAAEDDELFTSISGIGKKLASRIVIELREKVAALGIVGPAAVGRVAAAAGADDAALAREGLVGLGYTVAEAEGALVGTSGAPEERIRQALGALGLPT